MNTLLRAADRAPYEQQHSGSSTLHCARQLAGRTHYYDEGTRRYFGARVHRVWSDADGFLLGTVESVQAPVGRLYRAVVFDCEGTVIYRTETETDGCAGHKTIRGADKELSAFIRECDPVALARAALTNRVRRMRQEIEAIETALGSA